MLCCVVFFFLTDGTADGVAAGKIRNGMDLDLDWLLKKEKIRESSGN